MRRHVFFYALMLAACGQDTSAPTPTSSTSAAAPLPTPNAPASCGTDTWTSFAEAFFATHCSDCHDFSSLRTVTANQTKIKSYVGQGVMPPNGGVSSADRQRLVAWIGCGLPP